MATEKLVGTGIKAFESGQGATGTIRFLDSPDEVLEFIDGPAPLRLPRRHGRHRPLDMYKVLARKSKEDKIRDGVMVYTREFLMPHAMRAGVWDKFLAEGFDTMQPNAEAAWPVLTSERAAEILTPVLLFGKGFPHVSEGA